MCDSVCHSSIRTILIHNNIVVSYCLDVIRQTQWADVAETWREKCLNPRYVWLGIEDEVGEQCESGAKRFWSMRDDESRDGISMYRHRQSIIITFLNG